MTGRTGLVESEDLAVIELFSKLQKSNLREIGRLVRTTKKYRHEPSSFALALYLRETREMGNSEFDKSDRTIKQPDDKLDVPINVAYIRSKRVGGRKYTIESGQPSVSSDRHLRII